MLPVTISVSGLPVVIQNPFDQRFCYQTPSVVGMIGDESFEFFFSCEAFRREVIPAHLSIGAMYWNLPKIDIAIPADRPIAVVFRWGRVFGCYGGQVSTIDCEGNDLTCIPLLVHVCFNCRSLLADCLKLTKLLQSARHSVFHSDQTCCKVCGIQLSSSRHQRHFSLRRHRYYLVSTLLLCFLVEGAAFSLCGALASDCSFPPSLQASASALYSLP